MMKRTLVAVTAAAALAAGTFAVPQKAEAYAWWVIPSIVVGAAVVGGAAVASSRAYAYQPYAYQPYGYQPYAAAPRGTVHVAPTRGCYLQESPALFGGYRYIEVCN